MKFILLFLFLPLTVNATTYVFQPGEPMEVISPTSSGYIISNMGGNGNTIVQQMGNMTTIYGGEQPTTMILEDTPNTGGVELAVPVEYTE
jgi:hypothetical protein